MTHPPHYAEIADAMREQAMARRRNVSEPARGEQTMLTKYERALLTALEALPRDYVDHSGLCPYLHQAGVDTGWPSRLTPLFRQWPEYSGDPIYPVPPCGTAESPAHAYHGSCSADLWDRDHPYGAARWRLIDWCIAELRARNTAPDKDART